MDNIRFKYLYRDGSNFKKWADVVFSDPDNMELREIKNALEAAFETDGLFIAHQIRIPEAFLYGNSDADADDHCYHEYYGIERTSHSANDRYHRSIRQFVTEVEAGSRRGWTPFDPFDRQIR